MRAGAGPTENHFLTPAPPHGTLHVTPGTFDAGETTERFMLVEQLLQNNPDLPLKCPFPRA